MEKNWTMLEFFKFCDKWANWFLLFKKGSTHVFTELITGTIEAKYYSAMGMSRRNDFVEMMLVFYGR